MSENKFKVLTSKPGRLNKYVKYYNNSKNNGISWCINGKPTDNVCNVLPNCVGWACGRFNHIYSEITGYDGMKYPKFCCNAENFIEVAKTYGLSIGMEPKPGAIMCWQKGSTLNDRDGAGHVAVVEEVQSPTQIITSESGYGSFDFANKTRIKGDGNWGASSTYTFRGFIYNPAVTCSSDESQQPLTSNVSSNNGKDESKNQIFIKVHNLRIRKNPSIKGIVLKFAKQNYYYTYTDTISDSCYTWYKIGSDSWVAYSDEWAILYPTKEDNCQCVTSTIDLKVGDSVIMMAGAPVYGQTRTFSSWVYNTNLFIREINGDKVVVSIYKSGAITGIVDRKYLIKL